MLKIKNNVDLKELEKYGFKEYSDGARGYSSYPRTYKEYAEIIIETDKIIEINPFGENDVIVSSLLDTLYDLIQANLVEKV